ncbi:MAG: hypothetical protein LBR34_06090, partial [Prevotella sp.]|nr:hypothetical protein [Prevotella sp.]
MKRNIFCILTGALVVFSSCGTKSILTREIRNDVGEQIGKLQLYIDRAIILEREVDASEPRSLKDGVYSIKEGKTYYVIEFEKELAGVINTATATDDKLEVLFGNSDWDYLVFKNYSDNEFYQLVGTINKADNSFWVSYGARDYKVMQG